MSRGLSGLSPLLFIRADFRLFDPISSIRSEVSAREDKRADIDDSQGARREINIHARVGP